MTMRVVSKIGTLPSAPRFGMFGSALRLGLLAGRGQRKLISMLPPQIRPRTLTIVPQPPSLNGARSVGHPFVRAIRIAMLPSRYEK